MVRALMFPSQQETWLDLQEAQTPEELWTVLLAPHSIRSSSAWDEAFLLFRRFHLEDPADAAITALLLCTDDRWRKVTHHLIAEFDESGLLDTQVLDQLATWFLATDLEMRVPRILFAGAPVLFIDSESKGEPVVVELPTRARIPSRSRRGHGDDTVLVRRPTWPSLRRWAAARQLRSAGARWSDIVDLAAGLPSRDATMLLAGLMDAAESIPEDERAAAIEVGLTSGSGVVRLAALPAFAALEGPDAAKQRAAADPAEKVRNWARKADALIPEEPPKTGPAERRPGRGRTRHGDQPTLF